MKKSLRNLLIFLGIAVALFAVYFIFFKNNTAPKPAATTSALSSTTRNSATAPLAASGNATGSQLLSLLNRVTTLTLNDDIFANPAFALLSDISITLPPVDARGRRNPFAPIGAGNAIIVVPTTETTTGATAVPAGTNTQ